MEGGSRLTEHVRAGMRAHVCERGADPGGVLTHLNGGLGAALCFSFLCGFPALTGLRVETGTNEQLHPAWLPGCQGLWDYRQSVAPSLPSFFTFFLPFAPFTLSLALRRLISPFPRFSLSLICANPALSSLCLD